MDATGLIIGLLDLLVGLLLFAVAVPLIRGKVGMNHWYGVRVRQSFESEEKWYKINRYGGRQLMIWGLIIAAMGAVGAFVDMDERTEMLLLFALVPLLVFVPAVRSVLYARKA
ncbi:MAG: SdpI family protein [Methanomassiliicoccus sp.]|nr:SdpI family protein [Methanomassiliicoccus sp.]